MAILKLKPAFKDYIWGGHRLVEQFHKEYSGDILAESWELSCHPDGPSRIANGPWAGKTLPEYIADQGKDILGTNCRRFLEFPILTKFIDAQDNLSIQVHPNNDYALENEGQYGKTEMWYVVDCKEGSFLYYGFSRKIDQDEFRQRIQDNTLLEVLNKVPVQKGDVLFIEAGTIHAIGKDILIAEIQQNSNVTYRVYDYGRVGKDNRPRDLHIEKALAVTSRIPLVKSRSAVPHLAQCDYFTVDKLNLDGVVMRSLSGTITQESFASLLILEGEGTITCQGEEETFRKGDSLMVTAGSGEYVLQGSFQALLTTIEPKKNPVRIAAVMDTQSIELGLMDEKEQFLEHESLKLSWDESQAQTVQRISSTVHKMLCRQGLGLDQCVGMGLIYTQSPFQPAATSEPSSMVPLLQKQLPIPVYEQKVHPSQAGENILVQAAKLA